MPGAEKQGSHIHEASARLAAIVESSEDAIFSKTLDGVITSWNPAAERIFRHAAGEAIGRSIRILVPPERIPEMHENLDRIRRGEQVRRPETVRMRKGGERIPVSVSVSPIRDPDGRVVGISKIVRELSVRREENVLELDAARERQRMQARIRELEALNEELDAFNHSVSHDLRAPLRHVTAFVDILRSEAASRLTDGDKSLLGQITHSVDRMRQLIDDLLSFSRIGRVEMRKTPVCLDSLLEELLPDGTLETKGRNIAWKVQAALPTVWADRGLLRQVFLNLVSNAVKFTSVRSEARIEIGSGSEAGGEKVIFVRDNGAGFDPKYASKLFGAFQRLHRREEFEGVGVGLANVERIIRRHGGRVWAEGEVGNGATFYFSLPETASEE